MGKDSSKNASSAGCSSTRGGKSGGSASGGKEGSGYEYSPIVTADSGPLLHAAHQGNARKVREILSEVESPNVADYDKRTALHIAAAEGHMEVVQLLIKKGANVNVSDRFGGTPLDDAMRHHHAQVAKYLRSKGAESKSNKAHDLVHAASVNDLNTVKQLVEHGVDVNAADYNKSTALHVAVAGAHYEMVKYLLKRGADPLHADRFGGTPLDEAKRHKSRTGADFILEAIEAALPKPDKPVHSKWYTNLFLWFFLFWEVAFIILWAIFVEYGPDAATLSNDTVTDTLYNATGPGVYTSTRAIVAADTPHGREEVQRLYPLYQDVNVMIYIGFGFLMTFLRKHGYSSVGFNFLIGAFVFQWYILCAGFFEGAFHGFAGVHKTQKIQLSIELLTRASFAAGSVLISFGAVLGKVSALQVLFMALIEIVGYSIEEQVGLYLGIPDVGGSMTIHMYGAFFGLACTLVMTPAKAKGSDENGADYRADLFSMIGTIFLFLFWPSFNGFLAKGNAQHRAIVNTTASLAASTCVAFLASHVLRKERKFNMVDIQNATLAGGVAVGATADMNILPFGALLVGATAGFVSVLGYVHIQPRLERRLGLHDTCGINNLHGMPSIIGAVASMIVAGVVTVDKYPGDSLAAMYPKIADGTRTASVQAAMQLAYMWIVIGFGLVFGAVTGLVMRCSCCHKPTAYFVDSEHWEVPSLETPYYFDHRGEIVRIAEAEQEIKERDSGQYGYSAALSNSRSYSSGARSRSNLLSFSGSRSRSRSR